MQFLVRSFSARTKKKRARGSIDLCLMPRLGAMHACLTRMFYAPESYHTYMYLMWKENNWEKLKNCTFFSLSLYINNNYQRAREKWKLNTHILYVHEQSMNYFFKKKKKKKVLYMYGGHPLVLWYYNFLRLNCLFVADAVCCV